jgi:two-component system phosphate regulon sensor histidine kinase PhoR
MRRTLLRQVYPYYLLLVLLALVALTAFATLTFRGIFYRQLEDQLLTVAGVVRNVVGFKEIPQSQLLQSVAVRVGRDTGTRLTILRPDGSVLSDSEADPAGLPDQAGYPEVRDALAGEQAVEIRPRAQNGREMFVALPVHREGGVVAVVRISKSLSQIDDRMGEVSGSLFLVGILILIVTGVFAYVTVKRLTEPLIAIERAAHKYANGDLDFRVFVSTPEELRSLGQAMNTMAEQMKVRITTVSRQRNELEAILSSMVEGVVVLDQQMRIKSLNKAAATLLDKDADAVRGRPLIECVRNADIDEFAERAYHSVGPIEGNVTIYNDDIIHLQLHGTVLTRENGRRIGTLLVLNDITRLKQLEDVRKDFVANVSHELKTPITSIKGFVETLLDGAIEDKDQAQRFLTIISNQTNRLHAIIEDLLSLSRLEQHEAPIEFDYYSVAEVVNAAKEICEPRAQSKGITIEDTYSGKSSAWLNPNLLEQALVNLVDNAIKYSSENTRVKVEVTNRRQQLRIAVADTGQGISRRDQARLFERFYRTDKARSRDMGGTGLGLAIVKHISIAHGGEVTVDSELGKGSTFTVTIPQPAEGERPKAATA